MNKKNREISEGGTVTGLPPEGLPPEQAGEQLALQVAKVKESKAARFKRLAGKRVSKALTALGFVKNLSNSSQYEYTPEQAAKIIAAIHDAVQDLSRKFANPTVRVKGQLFEV